jgi:hypothetical protein
MIEKLWKMLAEATPRPWENNDGCVYFTDSHGYDVAECDEDDDAALIAAAVNALPALLDTAEAWRDYLSAQHTIDKSLHMDNHRDAARARDRQAQAIDRARHALAALAKETP